MVVVRFLGFHRVWQGSGQVFDSVDLFLPDIVYDTQVRLRDNAGCICGSAWKRAVWRSSHLPSGRD